MPVSTRRCAESTRGVEPIGGQWLEAHFGPDPPPSYMAQTALFALLYRMLLDCGFTGSLVLCVSLLPNLIYLVLPARRPGSSPTLRHQRGLGLMITPLSEKQ